jgi:uncharacterized protein with HEPN domain
MTRHDPGVTIRQLLDHAQGLLEIAQGRERSHLDTDRTFQWAVLRGLEVLGEAARRLPSDFHTRYPAIPWQNLIGMRNRLIHAYTVLHSISNEMLSNLTPSRLRGATRDSQRRTPSP